MFRNTPYAMKLAKALSQLTSLSSLDSNDSGEAVWANLLWYDEVKDIPGKRFITLSALVENIYWIPWQIST